MNKAKEIKSKHKLDLIIIDYLQLIEMKINYNTRQEETAYILRFFKKISRKLEIPIVILSQLSRTVEQRKNRRPKLHDLRSSGSIEEIADKVLFIYRDEYYNLNTEEKGIAEIIISKQNENSSNTIKLNFEKNIPLLKVSESERDSLSLSDTFS